MTTKTHSKSHDDDEPKPKATKHKDADEKPDAEPIHIMHQRIESEAGGKK